MPAKKPRKVSRSTTRKPRKPTARPANIKPSAHAGLPGWTQTADNRWECAPGLLLQLVVIRNENGFAAWIKGYNGDSLSLVGPYGTLEEAQKEVELAWYEHERATARSPSNGE
jgi:hypothetical protein